MTDVAFELEVPSANLHEITCLRTTVDIDSIATDTTVTFGYMYSVVLKDAELVDRIQKANAAQAPFKVTLRYKLGGRADALLFLKEQSHPIPCCESWTAIYTTTLDLEQ